ncbi:hypothetical protein MMYC01_207907 [Madurella mycetomatis]|uniref:Uncharacterized protein n=1 Tax=Madurella mycetomatis TaxID=100816 RepID=A0A175VZ45_9PEZI|nr:hypothetical protein MMYC01_207907 [Madurella mycetomatis]
MTASNTNNGKGSTAGSLLEDPIDYTDLKAWIQQQETNPKPLSPLQRRALSDLVFSLRSKEPELGNQDWISLLQRYIDFPKTKGASVAYHEEAAPNNKWSNRCTFKLAEDIDGMLFPNRDFGFVRIDGTLAMPVFARKKDAKKYAAKCCVEWLLAGEYMDINGGNVDFAGSKTKRKPAATATGPPPPPPLPAKTNGTITLTEQAGGGKPKPTQDPTPNPQTADMDEEEVPATKRVTEMCRLLQITAPRYDLKPSDDRGWSYTGHPDFGNDNLKVPKGLGVIEPTYGKTQAKERIAEKVLMWLLEEEAKRESDAQALVGAGGESEGAALNEGAD